MVVAQFGTMQKKYSASLNFVKTWFIHPATSFCALTSTTSTTSVKTTQRFRVRVTMGYDVIINMCTALHWDLFAGQERT